MNPCSEIDLEGGIKMSIINDIIVSKLKSQVITEIVDNKFNQVKHSSGKLRNFFGILSKVEKENLAICGGAVRDWWLDREPKDIDLVVNCPVGIVNMLERNFPHTRSQFNGFMFDVGGAKIDLWRLQDSWIFTQDMSMEKTWENLLISFPFNIDCILVFGDGRVLENGFFDGLYRQEIELINPINKNPITNIIQRAIRFKEKYGFKFGPKLQAEIDSRSKKSGINYSEIFKNFIGDSAKCLGSSN